MSRLVRVVGGSMAPTFRPSDLLLTRRVGRGGRGVGRGEVVVFRHGGAVMIKRVVGVGGDRIALEAGKLTINGDPVDGQPAVRGAYRHTWTVPPGTYFVAGDNAAVSDDSRVWSEPFVGAAHVQAVVTRRLAQWPARSPLPGWRGVRGFMRLLRAAATRRIA
ncbi:signal peptidase I [Demequina sp. TTPB684]|uniref:signal peptidase I n=1 Tax=unclassified Demequina TaxID=2620311 RepID=UPI001CF2C7B9|nr:MULTISPECIES: signal peptidase I [unclassified Demequina]MCB2412219.1 signal peptidase I [Demequina sp. TTPB684]UPU88009.1 signal peptidase I [Demequina sp. TMPB413]